MTDKHIDSAHKELAKWLSCRQCETEQMAERNGLPDLALITTDDEAATALDGFERGSCERAILFIKWIELTKTFKKLLSIPIAREEFQHDPDLIARYYFTRMVTLCKTRDHVKATAQCVRPGHVAWQMLVEKGLQILEKKTA